MFIVAIIYCRFDTCYTGPLCQMDSERRSMAECIAAKLDDVYFLKVESAIALDQPVRLIQRG